MASDLLIQAVGEYQHSNMLLKAGITLAIFLFLTIGLYLIQWNEPNKKKWLSQRWIITLGWFCFAVFILLLDGILLKLGITTIVFGCAAALGGIFVLSNTVQHMSEIRFSKGEWSVDAKIRKPEGAKNVRTNKKVRRV